MQYALRIEQLRDQRSELYEQVRRLRDQSFQLRELAFDQLRGRAEGDPDQTYIQIDEIDKEIDRLDREERQVHDEFWKGVKNSHKFFLRPTGGFFGLLSRPLGDVPQFMPILDPTEEELAAAPSYRRAGFMLLLAAVGCLLGMAVTTPWLLISPATLAFNAYASIMPDVFAIIWTVITGYWFMRLIGRGGEVSGSSHGKFLDRAALREEQWFRSGAESWNSWQRVYSCVAFGLMHVGNFIYPLASLIVVGLVGGVYMAAYLREYRRTGSYERATIAAAKLHAAYNRFALVYMVVAVSLMIIGSITM